MTPSHTAVQVRAAHQRGRIAWWQLMAMGIPVSTARSWIRSGWLIATLPRVYAVGVPLEDVEAR